MCSDKGTAAEAVAVHLHPWPLLEGVQPVAKAVPHDHRHHERARLCSPALPVKICMFICLKEGRY